MDKKRQLGIIGGTLGVIAVVLVVTVAWAAFLTNLTINGSATVAKSSWGVEFQNLQAAQAGNDDGVTHGVTLGATAPSITNNSTTIGNYSVTLSKPGDYVIYEFDIVNTGTFDAKIDTGFALPTPTCTKTGSGTDANATTVCGNLSYTLTYKTGGATLASGNTLAAGATQTVQLKLYYNKNATTAQLPLDNVDVSNLGITIPYVQI